MSLMATSIATNINSFTDLYPSILLCVTMITLNITTIQWVPTITPSLTINDRLNSTDHLILPKTKGKIITTKSITKSITQNQIINTTNIAIQITTTDHTPTTKIIPIQTIMRGTTTGRKDGDNLINELF